MRELPESNMEIASIVKKWNRDKYSSPLIDVDNTQSYSNNLSLNVGDGATNSPSKQSLLDHDSSLDMKKRPPIC